MRNKLNNSKFQAIARAMTRNYGVKVVFGGFTPKTDGQTIYLPANADSLPEHDQDSLHGWLDHECCHVEQEVIAKRDGTTSTMKLMGGAAKKRGPKYQLMLNVFEDIRIENDKAAEFPGVSENLRLVNERSIARYVKGSTGDFWQDIAGAIIATGRRLDTSWISGGVKVIIDLIADELSETDSMSSVDDAWSLAQRTVDKIAELAEAAAEEADKREEEEEAEDGDDSEDGEGSCDDGDIETDEKRESGSESDDDGDDDAEDSDDENGSESTESGDDGEDEESDESGEGEGDESEGEPSESTDLGDKEGEGDAKGKPADVSDLSDDELEEALKELENVSDEPEVTDFINNTKEDLEEAATEEAETAGDRSIAPLSISQRDGFTKTPKGDIEMFEAAREEVTSQIGTLKRKLALYLQAQKQVHFAGDKEDGLLDEGALYSIKSGNRRVFAQQTTAVTNNTAVTLLVDNSGSMALAAGSGKDRSWYARCTAVALSETLDHIGVPFEVLGFDNESPACGLRSCRSWLKGNPGCTRWSAFRISPIKLFTDSYRKARERFSAIQPGHQNGDGDAVMFAAKRLARRKEARKLLIVISDGTPCGALDYRVGDADLRRVIKEVTSSGIEVIGIGAADDAVKEFYNHETGARHIVINDLTKLARTVFNVLRANLSGRRAA